MRTIGIAVFLLVLACFANPVHAVDLQTLQKGTIIVTGDAFPSERYAAEEFQRLFKEMTGSELPITAGPAPQTYAIFIGPGAVSGAGELAFPVDTFGEEGLRIRIDDNAMAIAGGRPRGTLYGVYEFFERYLGVRFLTYDHTYFPDTASVKPWNTDDYAYTPPFSFRWSYYNENSLRPEFAARLRVNTVSDDEKLGGKTQQSLINHSLFRWINPGLYGESHPEYFALVNGERKLSIGGGGPEPCVTNPDVIKIVSEGVVKDLDANPKQQNISVSQNDNDAYCQCPQCKEVIDREGTPMGPQLALVNAVAEAVEKTHPQTKVGTLAYWYTRTPPKTIVPRSNIQIQLCSIECCTFHALDDPACEKNRAFCADLQGWKEICKDIWIWNYNTNFSCYDLPFPNLRSIGKNVRFFLNNNAKGIFMQANGNGTSGELSDLRNYVMAQCLWHPGQDSWPLVEEFCRLHYQESAGPILDYLVMFHDNIEAMGLHPTCFPSAEAVGLTPDIARKAFDYFAQARLLAQSDAVRARVEKASICAYKAMVVSGGSGWAYDSGKCRRTWPDASYAGLLEQYAGLVDKYAVTMASEGQAMAQYLDSARRQLALDAVRLENEVWRLTVLPSENGKMVEMWHKPTQRSLLSAMEHADILKATFEELAVEGFDRNLPCPFAAVVEGNTLRLTRALEDGSILERVIALKPETPGTIFLDTTLTNRTAATKAYQIKARPELNPGSTASDCTVVSAYVKTDQWTRFNREWNGATGPDAGLLTQAPSHGLAFYNHEAKFGVALLYDGAQFERPSLWWGPERPQINLELFASRREVAQGQAMSFSYQIVFLDAPPV